VLAAQLTGHAAAGAWLLAAVGIGNVVGSLALLARPLTGEPVRLSLVLGAAVASGYLLIALAPTYPIMLAAGVLAGVSTAGWVSASLAARQRHAPPGRQAEIFTALAGWKIAAGSAGTAVAGLLAEHSPRLVLATAAAVAVLSAVAAALDGDPSSGFGHSDGVAPSE
jgi:predicted MFS family arabinose efflux permease